MPIGRVIPQGVGTAYRLAEFVGRGLRKDSPYWVGQRCVFRREDLDLIQEDLVRYRTAVSNCEPLFLDGNRSHKRSADQNEDSARSEGCATRVLVVLPRS